MDNRLLEILQNPDLLVSNDIEILQNVISKYPFVQSYRAIQLLATHRFKQDNYASKLSETAAFTTDKKILYQLIHQKEIGKNTVVNEVLRENNSIGNKEILTEKEPLSKVEKLIALPETKFQEVEIKPVDLPKKVYIDGELNRILFEGEEDFLNEENETIDLGATQESGKIVIASKEGIAGDFSESTREFTTETIIDEEKVKSEEEIIESGAELSFHGETEFLPNVKIEVKNEVLGHFAAENKMSKYEAEMQKLIAEVEAKMKKSSAKKVEKEDDLEDNHSLDFTGISHDENTVKIEKTESNSVNQVEKEETNSTWKPMDFQAKKSTFRNNEILENTGSAIETKEIIEKNPEEIQENNKDLLSSKKGVNIDSEIKEKIEETSLGKEISNVPVFINTWQTWLKLNPETPVLKENIKQKAIESFLEKEPKISKLKEESSFIIKDKGDNISHLMTETLANLYLDQKLYSKAQKAFELLIEKNPQKSRKFKDKIQEIKDLKNQK